MEILVNLAKFCGKKGRLDTKLSLSFFPIGCENETGQKG
jgi:hypothetical protein